MKQLCAIGLIILLLAACGGGNETTGETTVSNSAPIAVQPETADRAETDSDGDTAVAAAENPSAMSAPVSLDYSMADLLGDSDPNLYALPAPDGAATSTNSLELSYGTSQSPADVIATYAQLLPALGWQEDETSSESSTFGESYSAQQGPNAFLVWAADAPAGSRVNLSIYYYVSGELIDVTAVPVIADAVLLKVSQTIDFRYTDAPPLSEQADAFRPPFEENLPGKGWELSFEDIREDGGNLQYVRMAANGAEDQVYINLSGSSVSIRGDFSSLAQGNNAAYVALEPTATPATVAGETWPSNTIPAINPADYNGKVVASGSSAIFPLAEAVAERFQDDGFGGNITIDNIGSTLDPLCGGQADIANYVTQIISQSDLNECAPEGAEGIDFVVGRDVLVMAVNPANDFAAEMTQAELALALTTAETWADINPAWPDLMIQRFYPAIAYDLPAAFLFTDPQLMENAPNLTRSEDNSALVAGVAENEGAIGFFAYGVYQENQESVTAVRVDGYAPEEGSYLLSLPLHMVTFDTIMQEKPQVATYLGYVLVHGPELAQDVGFAPPDAETRRENEALWLEIMGE